jgi:CBS domain-containing protein
MGPESKEIPTAALVKDVMTAEVCWIDDTSSVAQAARLMTEHNVGLLPVKDRETRLLRGVVTDRDLVLRILAQGGLDPAITPVASIQTTGGIALIYDDANLADAERLMIDRGVRRLLVLRRSDHQVIGVISVDDLAMFGYRRRAGDVLGSTVRGPEGTDLSRGQRVLAVEGVTTSEDIGRPSGAAHSVYGVEDAMTYGVEWLAATDSCRSAAFRMLSRNVGCLLVCEASADGPPKLVGVLTDRDLVVRLLAQGRSPDTTIVKDVATHNPVCCFDDDDLSDVRRCMIARGVRRLPVLKRDSREVAGIISIDDVALLASRKAGAILRAATTGGGKAPVFPDQGAASSTSASGSIGPAEKPMVTEPTKSAAFPTTTTSSAPA